MRTPTTLELRHVNDLRAEAEYLSTLSKAKFTRLCRKYDVPSAQGFSYSKRTFVVDGDTFISAAGETIHMTSEEVMDLSVAYRDAEAATQDAVLASYELRKACGAGPSTQWDPKTKTWVYPDEVSLPGEEPKFDVPAPACPCAEEAPVTP